jgi:glycosyltransferase involved in cell wall biosynthesis
MRAGLFLEGLSRSHDVRVLVVPLFRDLGRHDPVLRLAADVQMLGLDDVDPVADATARLATPAGRARMEALHPVPSLCHHATVAAAKEVARYAAGAAVVHVLRLYLAPLLDVVLDDPARPAIILDVDDIESVSHRRLGEEDEARRFERLESWYLPRVDHVVTASTTDAVALGARLGLAEVTPVTNAVRPPPEIDETAGPHDLLFVGNLSYRPNIDAARWFCREVLPLLDGVTIALVGGAPDPSIRALAADPRVKVAADVADVTPWYAGARVVVAPLLAGGGTRTKVAEAFAHRRPVVATPIAVEGLAWNGADGPALVAESPAAFAAACRRLLDDPALAAALAARGEQEVRAGATVEAVLPAIDAVVRRTLTQHVRGGRE